MDLSRRLGRVPAWRPSLQAACARERADQELLVRRRLRFAEPLGTPEQPEASLGQHVFRPQGERRRLDRHLLRPEDAGWPGKELDRDATGPRLVPDLPLLQPAGALLR